MIDAREQLLKEAQVVLVRLKESTDEAEKLSEDRKQLTDAIEAEFPEFEQIDKALAEAEATKKRLSVQAGGLEKSIKKAQADFREAHPDHPIKTFFGGVLQESTHKDQIIHIDEQLVFQMMANKLRDAKYLHKTISVFRKVFKLDKKALREEIVAGNLTLGESAIKLGATVRIALSKNKLREWSAGDDTAAGDD